MKIAVTAASGKLGTSIIQELTVAIGSQNVIGLARNPEKAQHLGVEIREGDYSDPDSLKNSLNGVEALVLISGMDDPRERIQQHRNVINAAKLNGVKKIVYTSIIGAEENTSFSPVVKSNRQTEIDVQESGLAWVIGRNGIYIEPDLEYLDNYIKAGEISNCAGDGKCAYTSRSELAYAYTQMLLNENLKGQVFNLAGSPITQSELAKGINQVYNTSLKYVPIGVETYENDRKAALGDFMGTIIAGIYEGIRIGANDVATDFEKVAGRPHLSTIEMISSFKNQSR
ncbi:SDR family oxidoreductase [Algoriphagus winogradskyi]|uniref:NAD(P)H dehydrogenase (Quinone) n=1 Tax=Algoriphagus winogradskyi TaxID=237017 RepID=A0ABY1NX90_9BACT|nr:SDR family oxidoreductase [Algoriphagus winogradskyi]SMP20978.1 NAD(P)H dehydrogenase (quinone) [Algoriphagus winogradskyi]